MIETRTPKIVSHQKMRDLAVLPLFHKLDGRKIVVAGFEVGALWKTELLAATGAQIALYLGNVKTSEHDRVFGDLTNVTIHERKWQPEDLLGAAVAVSQSISDDDAIAFVNAARSHGVIVNVIDQPKYSDFQFGAIVNRSPLVIGISTDGASPAMGQELRGRFETQFPLKISDWLKKAAAWRPKIKSSNLGAVQKRELWHKFANYVLDNPAQKPSDEFFENLINSTPKQNGQVTLIGAGPGDPELLTLGALRALQSADVILVDDLVAPEILDFARREADIISVGKRGRKPSIAQTTIIELMIEHAKQNKNVVRLKGGDVLVFGRATDEIQACEQANIPIKILTGISAAQGVAATLGISLTDREYSQRVQFITGAGKKGGLPPEINFTAVADKDATTFVYMPRGTSVMFVENAIAYGLSPDTPAAIIIDGTRAEQKNIFATIKEIPEIFKGFEPNGPEILMIGNVLKNSPLYAKG